MVWSKWSKTSDEPGRSAGWSSDRVRSLLLNTARRWGWCSLRSRPLLGHGGRAISDAHSWSRTAQPPLWLAPTATTMMVMMIAMAMETRAMMVKILPSMRPTLMFCSLVY
jgi:hypothetical protein